MSQTLTTPKGIAVYPHINTPDTKFDPVGHFKVDLRVPADEGGAEFAATIDAMIERQYEAVLEETGKKKVKRSNEPYTIDEDTGDYIFKFKSKAGGVTKAGEKWTRTITVVDAALNPCPGAKVGGGSEIIVATEPFPYYTAAIGCGVSLRIKAVQVITLREWGQSVEGLGFESTDGFTASEAHTTPFESQADESADDDDDEDF
jgi:hypothetical protein